LFIRQVSMMPRCSSVGKVLAAGSPGEGARLFFAAGWEAVGTIFTESYVSLASFCLLSASVYAQALCCCRLSHL